MRIRTPKMYLRESGYANPANCLTLKNLWVPIGQSLDLIDYVAGAHLSGAFTSKSDSGYAVPSIASNTALTGGNIADPGTANFIWLATYKQLDVLNSIRLGTSAGNYVDLSQFTGGIVGAGGSDAAGFSVTADTTNVRTCAIVRSAAAAADVLIDGVVNASTTTDVGAITLGNFISMVSVAEFYGSALFVFSGSLPSNYLTVMAEIDANFSAGNYRLPSACEAWT